MSGKHVKSRRYPNGGTHTESYPCIIAFPGGTGTLEEIAEVMSKVSLGHLDAPCILYDLDGYYAGLKALLAHMVKMGLSSPERQSGIYFAKELDEIKSILKRA